MLSCAEEGKLGKTVTNETTKEDSPVHTEEEAHHNGFQDMETESTKRMIRCNPAPGAGEKPSPSKTAVATPVPDPKTKTVQSFTSLLKQKMGIGIPRASPEVSKKKQQSKEVCNLNQGNEEATCRNQAPEVSEEVCNLNQGNEEAMHRNQAPEVKERNIA